MVFFFKKKYPIILPRERHAMSLDPIDRGVVDILHRIRRKGFQACLVGGCVRDILLGKKPKDFDIATDARPRQVKTLFKRCFLIGRRFRLAHVYISHERFVEVATYRAAVDPEEVQGGRFAANNVFGTIEEDALRRDFTVNALYFDAADFSIIDFTGGLEDLKKKVLRSIGDPAKRFREDPVRIIRAARFCAQLGFQPSKKDFKAAVASAPLIKEANANRMLEELYKILKCGASAGTIQNLKKYRILPHWLPELAPEKYHPALFRRLAVMDGRRAAGGEIPNNVLLSVLLYDLFAEVIAASENRGFHEAFLLLKEKFQEMAVRLRLPRVEWDKTCNTAARQIIFSRVPGGRKGKRFEKKFVHNAFFPDALLFFEILAEAAGGLDEQLRYWKRRATSRMSSPDQ